VAGDPFHSDSTAFPEREVPNDGSSRTFGRPLGFRSGYAVRPTRLPQSIVPCGERDCFEGPNERSAAPIPFSR